MLSRITDYSSSRWGKWTVIAVWLAMSIVIVSMAPTLQDVTENDEGSFLPEGAESTRVNELVRERFPSTGAPAIIVFRDDAGLSDADLGRAKQLNDWLLSDEAPANIDQNGVVSVFTAPQAAESLRSADGRTMTVIATVTDEGEEEAFFDAVDAVREQAQHTAADGLEIYVSGPAGLITDLVAVFERIDGFLIAVTATLVLVLLVAIYRSPVVALVPLVSVGWVFTLAGAIGALLAQRFGLPVNGQSSGIMTVLLFGAGTDYCLFISSRYREELALVEDKHEAMRRTMRAVGEAIASSAGTVLVATLALLLATLRSNKTLGPLLAVAVATMLVASLTLVPALMTVLGRWAFWPFRPAYDPAAAGRRTEAETHGVWGRIAAVVARRPAAVLAATVALFLVLSLGLLRYRDNYDTLSSLPAGAESREGFEVLRESFPAGDLAPTEIYVDLPDGVSATDRLPQIEQFTRTIAESDGIAAAQSAGAPFGAQAPAGAAQVAAAAQALPPPVRQAIDRGEGGPPDGGAAADAALGQQIGVYAAARRFVSPDGGVARVSLTLEENPYSLDAINRTAALRREARAAAQASGLGDATVLVGGPTATAADTKAAQNRDTAIVLPVILLAIGVILGLLLRSLIAPLYLLATVVLSYAATLGIATVVFRDVFGHEGVSGGVPFFLFVFLVALGVDYNIFLMARVREETARFGLRQGTQRALGRTGGVITSAGIILAGTFAALMTLPLRDLFQIGFTVALGVLIDTFVVRSLMVPSIVLLLGRWNWWPSRPRTERREREPVALAGG